MLKQAFKFDPNSTDNQGRWRLRDPGQFKRFWTEQDKDDKGISYIMGELKSGGTEVRAIRFNKSKWSESKAATWWNKNKSGFKKSWSDKNWAAWKKEQRKKAMLDMLVKVARLIDKR